MSGISGITGSFTYSYDNVGAVMLEFDFGTAVDEKTADVRERASALDLPDGCSSPEVSSLDLNGQATATIYVTSTEDSGSDVAYAAAEAEKLAGKFSAIDGVGSVETDGEPSHRVSITPLKGLESITSIDDLKSFALGNGVTIDDVAVIEERTAQTVIKKEDGLYALTLTAEVYGLDSGSAGNMLMDAALQVLDKEDGDTMAELNIKKCLSKYKVYGIIRL